MHRFGLFALILSTPSLAAYIQPADTQVQFTVDCPPDASDPFFCSKIQASLDRAGYHLSRILEFPIPLQVNVSVLDLCQSATQLDGECKNAIAAASPFEMVSLQDGQEPELNTSFKVVYPIGLMRQKQHAKGSGNSYLPEEAGTFDILMLINNQQKDTMYFDKYILQAVEDTAAPSPILFNQTDFVMVALHELLHGMGLLSSFQKPKAPLLMTYPDLSDKAFLPAMDMQGDRVQKINSISVYDLHLATKDDSGKLRKWSDALSSLEQWMANGNMQATAVLSLDTLSPQKLYFVSDEYGPMRLDSDSPSHTYKALVEGEDQHDFVMNAMALPGETLEERNQKVGNVLPVGNGILAALKSLGYTLTPEAIQALEQTSQDSGAARGSLSWMVAAIFFLVLSLG